MIEPLVITSQGILKGVVIESEFGRFISFNGIPYAESPIGELRFRDPQPPKFWKGVREAKNEGGVSAQIHFTIRKFVGGDDCLYLNVSTKNLSGKKPVMVWIHGGGFRVGSGNADFHRPDYLVRHDIVFVSINYRLGMLGFLNMDCDNCSGNQGLKDQIFALKWVQENIEAFGGDKNNVTIFGESAGATSVHYLCISPLAKGLFHKAILQSGVSINPWAFQTSNKEYASKIAAELGNSSSDNKEIVKFLQAIPIEKIFEIQSKIASKRGSLQLEYSFVPTVDEKCPNPFLPKPLSDMIKNVVDVPLIIGYNSDEGIISFDPSGVEEMYKRINENFEEYLSKDLRVNLSTVSQFSRDVRNIYFKGNPITTEEQNGLIQFKGDVLFVNGIYYIIDNLFHKKTPTYLYQYSHSPKTSLLKKTFKINIEGACHGDELSSLFYLDAFPANMQLHKGTKDYLVMQCMTKMWTDFAKTGNPTPRTDELINVKWFPYNSNRKFCFRIAEELTTVENFEKESWKIWKPIFNKYKLF